MTYQRVRPLARRTRRLIPKPRMTAMLRRHDALLFQQGELDTSAHADACNGRHGHHGHEGHYGPRLRAAPVVAWVNPIHRLSGLAKEARTLCK